MSNVLRHKGYLAAVEFDAEDGVFFGRIAGISDGVGFHGDTVDGLRAAFEEMVDDYIESCAKIGKAPEKPYSGKIMFRIDPSVHARAALAAELAGKSLNAWGETVLRMAAEKTVGDASQSGAAART